MIVGFLAKYDFAKAAQLGMATGAVMKIMPKMVAMFMEGLMPIAEAAKEFANKRLGGRSVNIGMDAALTVGHSTVMSTNLLMVPISLALAITTTPITANPIFPNDFVETANNPAGQIPQSTDVTCPLVPTL